MKSTFKKVLSILIVVCMMLSALPFTVSAADTSVSTWEGLLSAVASASAGDTITLTADVTATSTLTVSGSVKINGSKTITRSASYADSVFVVNGALTLENVTVNGNRTGTATADLANALIVVNTGAVFTMNSGAVLTTNRANALVSGGGVTVAGGQFIMNSGASIVDMHIHNSNSTGAIKVGPAVYVTSGTFTMNGGNIAYCDGIVGAVSILGGSFNMTGGTISDSIANQSGVGGGGVYNEGTFTMSGGTISNNTSWLKGGGVYNAGTFNLTDGTITGNATALEGSTSADGAGVCTAGTFTMSGGTITNNTAQSSSGGVLVTAGTFNLTGGTITGNTASAYSGGGVFVSGGLFNMTGGSIVNNSANQFGGAIAATAQGGTPVNVTGGRILGNTCGANFGGADIYVTKAGNVASTTLGSGCIVDRLYVDNRGNRYSANNAVLAPSSSLTAEYGYIYVTNGASHTFGEWEVTVQPGCLTTGLKQRTCSVCGTVEEEVVPARGHNTVIESVNPTCTEAGFVRYYCPVCGTESSRTIVPALGHEGGMWHVTTPATASQAGVKTKYCKRCGVVTDTASYTANDPVIKFTMSEPEEFDDDYNTITAEISLENNPGVWGLSFYFFYDPAFSAISATNGTLLYADPDENMVGALDLVVENDSEACEVFEIAGESTANVKAASFYAEAPGITNVTTDGTLASIVFKYDAELEDTFRFAFAFDPDCVIDDNGDNVEFLFEEQSIAIEPLSSCEHVPGSWQTVSAATCTESGTRTKSCTICGRVLQTETIPPTGHTAGDWVVTVQPGVNEGERVKYCTVCGAVLETEILRPTQAINIYANDVTTTAGSTVTTNLYIENNTGIWGMRVFLYYPEDLTVTSVTNGNVFDNSTFELSELNFDPYDNCIASDVFSTLGITEPDIAATCFFFEDVEYDNVTGNGMLVTVTFSVPEGYYGDYDVHVFCDDAIDEDLNDLNVNGYGFVITAVDCLHENTAWSVTTEPTCTEYGVRSLVCSDCGAVIDTEPIAPNGHTFSDEWTIDVEPTATTPGQKSHHCIYCDAITDVTVIDPLALLGDVNGDGKINATDLRLMKKFMAGSISVSEIVLINTDIIVDNKVNVNDLRALKKLIVGASIS